MPRPQNKEALLNLAQQQYIKLINYVTQLEADNKHATFPNGYLNRNIRDVLAHLHHWHTLFLDWHVTGTNGNQPEMPAPGYTWKTTMDLNKHIQILYNTQSLEDTIKQLEQSHNLVISIIRDHSNEELFTKKYYKWTGSTSLGAYLISATSSHYDWGLKLIKRCMKGLPPIKK